jgi:mRNA-degrading endonuclease toxin of MazEF toxin-antitoxin module
LNFTRRLAVNCDRLSFSSTPQTRIFVAAPITSHLRVSDFDVPIHQWREAGLNTASTIRVHKLTVLAKDEIVRRLGELRGPDRTALTEVLRRAFSLDR